MQEIGKSFGFFDYAKVGVPILIAGIIFFALVGYKLLPDTKPSEDSGYGNNLYTTNAKNIIPAINIGTHTLA